MKTYRTIALTAVLFVAFTGLANAAHFGPNDLSPAWSNGAGVGIVDLLDSDYFGAYSEIDFMDFDGLYAYTAIAHESGHVNLVREGIPGSMSTTFSTADYSNWGEWETVDFDAGENLKFRDQSDGAPNVLIDPYDATKWAGNYLKLFQLEEDSAALTWLEGNPVLAAGTILVGWNDNHLKKDDFIDSDFDDIIVAMQPVPEPGTVLLLGVGLVGLAGIRRKMLK